MTVDVVWCDFGGVLTPPISRAIDAVEAATGIPWPVLAEAIEGVAAADGLSGLQPLELGTISQREWGDRVRARLAPGHAPLVDLGSWGDYWYRGRVVNVTLLDELERLAADGVRIGLLTNSVAEWEVHRTRMLRGRGCFDAYVRSHELGIAKPDPRIYAHADTVLPASDTSVLIDDSAENCAAARRHGWQSIHHTATSSTVAELLAL